MRGTNPKKYVFVNYAVLLNDLKFRIYRTITLLVFP